MSFQPGTWQQVGIRHGNAVEVERETAARFIDHRLTAQCIATELFPFDQHQPRRPCHRDGHDDHVRQVRIEHVALLAGQGNAAACLAALGRDLVEPPIAVFLGERDAAHGPFGEPRQPGLLLRIAGGGGDGVDGEGGCDIG